MENTETSTQQQFAKEICNLNISTGKLQALIATEYLNVEAEQIDNQKLLKEYLSDIVANCKRSLRLIEQSKIHLEKLTNSPKGTVNYSTNPRTKESKNRSKLQQPPSKRWPSPSPRAQCLQTSLLATDPV